MSNDSWNDDAGKAARILQIIVAALAMGASVFLVITLIVGPQVGPKSPIPLILIAVLLVVAELVARAVVLWNIDRKGRREIIKGTYKSVDLRQLTKAISSDVSDTPPDPHRDAKYLSVRVSATDASECGVV